MGNPRRAALGVAMGPVKCAGLIGPPGRRAAVAPSKGRPVRCLFALVGYKVWLGSVAIAGPAADPTPPPII